MSSPSTLDPSSSRLSDEAAQWCIRLHEPDFSDAEREQFDRWRASDAAHQEEFDAMLDIWALAGGLPPAHSE